MLIQVPLPRHENSLVKAYLELPGYPGAKPAPNPLLTLGSLDLDDLAVHQPGKEPSCPVFLAVLTGHYNFLGLNGKNPRSTAQPVF